MKIVRIFTYYIRYLLLSFERNPFIVLSITLAEHVSVRLNRYCFFSRTRSICSAPSISRSLPFSKPSFNFFNNIKNNNTMINFSYPYAINTHVRFLSSHVFSNLDFPRPVSGYVGRKCVFVHSVVKWRLIYPFLSSNRLPPKRIVSNLHRIRTPSRSRTSNVSDAHFEA